MTSAYLPAGGSRSAASSAGQGPGRDAVPAGPDEGDAVDPRWRRRLVLLGVVSAALVAGGMVPHLGSLTSPTTVTLVVGSAAWLLELLATPSSRVAEALALIVVGAAGAVLNTTASESPGFVLAFFAVTGFGLRFGTRVGALMSVAVAGMVDLGILLGSKDVVTSVTTSDLGLGFVFVVAAATRSARKAQTRSTRLLAELEESRAAQAAAAALAERTRLAREIHDILAHSLSGQVMSLEATRMLAERTAADPRVVAEIGRAHRLAKSGLADTRRAIGALRGDTLPGPDLLPQLVEEARSAHGIRATLRVVGDPRPVPTDTGLCLYRTAQEALTNTTKYAGRGAASDLVLTWTRDAVLLTVTDRRRAGASTGSGLPSGGYGLTGLRERAELAGGTLDAGPTPDGFEVSLALPLAQTTPADPAFEGHR